MCNFCNNAQFISSSPGWHWWLWCWNWVDQEYAVTHFYTCKHSWIFPKAPDFFWVSWKPKSTNDRSVWNQNWVNLKIKDQPMTRQIWENQDQNQLKIWSSDWIGSDNFQVSDWSVPGVLNQESVAVQALNFRDAWLKEIKTEAYINFWSHSSVRECVQMCVYKLFVWHFKRTNSGYTKFLTHQCKVPPVKCIINSSLDSIEVIKSELSVVKNDSRIY